MANSKNRSTSAPSGGSAKPPANPAQQPAQQRSAGQPRPSGQQRPAARQGAGAQQRAAGIENVSEAIAKAQHGRVNVTPAKAVEMAGRLYREGKFEQAAKVCQQILSARPGNADAHNILGVAFQAQGKTEDALVELQRAVKLAPDAANLRANFGEVLRQNGKLDEATSELNKAVELEPENSQALNNLGIIHYDRRMFKKAIGFYEQAVAIRPEMAEAHNNLGNARRMVGDIDGAFSAYQDALTHREIYPEAYNNLGTLLQQDKKLEEAEHAMRKAMAQNPRYIEAYNNLGSLLGAQKKEVDALRVLGDALKIAPSNPSTLLITARIQLRRGSNQAVEQATRLVLKQNPDNSEALTILGQVLHETDRYDEALEVLERAVKANPNSAESLNFYGVALKSVGRLDEAREYILKAIKQHDGMWGAFANLNDLVDFSTGVGEELFNRMDVIMQSAKNPSADAFLPLHFAYAKALEDRGEHERALTHYIAGGKIKRKQLEYDEGEIFGFFDQIREAFPKEFFANRKFAGIDDERPVFIIGMPRSGSTLVEQIVSSHPDVFGAGEVKYLSRAIGQLRDRFPSLPKFPMMMDKLTIPQLDIVGKKYLEALSNGAGEAKRITDKLLTNFFFVGLIHTLYPKAKFVNTMRDPVDTCLSGFTKLFKDDMPHSYDLTELGRYYGKYRELIEHWHKVLPEGVLMTVQYEDVVADTEKEARRLIEFLGLPWNKKCLDFHNSDRPVKTASVAQVRKPIYKSSVKRWAKYGAGLQPLIDAVAIRPGEPAAAAKKPVAAKAPAPVKAAAATKAPAVAKEPAVAKAPSAAKKPVKAKPKAKDSAKAIENA